MKSTKLMICKYFYKLFAPSEIFVPCNSKVFYNSPDVRGIYKIIYYLDEPYTSTRVLDVVF